MERVPEGYAHFVASALPDLLRFGAMLAGSADRGDDLVQSALVCTLVGWNRINGDPFGYARRCMVNANVSTWRRWGARVRYIGVTDEASADSSGAMTDAVVVREALATLPPRQRTVLVLRYYYGLSEQEIAQQMNCRPGTVKSQAARGLAALRARLGAADDVMPAAAGEVTA